jgi:hypothetical protein
MYDETRVFNATMYPARLTCLVLPFDYCSCGGINLGARRRIGAELSLLTGLRHLEVDEAFQCEASAGQFAVALAALSSLRHLRLCGEGPETNGADQGFKDVEAAIRGLSQLSHLDFEAHYDGALSSWRDLTLPAWAAFLVHLSLIHSDMDQAHVPALALVLAACTALESLALPDTKRRSILENSPEAISVSTLARVAASADSLQHLAIACICWSLPPAHHDAGWGSCWAGLTQLTSLWCSGLTFTEARDAAPGIAAPTGLRELRLCTESLDCKRARPEARANSAQDAAARSVAVAEARHWPALTRLTTLEFRGIREHLQQGQLGRVAAAQLGVSLAPLGAGLVPVHAEPHTQSEAPLKALRGGGCRLVLTAVGLDDSVVDEEGCALVLALRL